MNVGVIRNVCVCVCGERAPGRCPRCIMYSGTDSGRLGRTSARTLAHTPTHIDTQLQVHCSVRSGRGREDAAAIAYPRCTHICPRAPRRVCVRACARHSLGPTPALPPASCALCRAPSHSNPWPRCVISREAQRRGARGRSPTMSPRAASDPE